MRIVLTGGGTGGHVIPLAPIIEALRVQYLEQRDTLPAEVDPSKLELFFVGVIDKNTSSFLSSYDIQAIPVPSGKLRRYPSFRSIVDLLVWLPAGIALALFRMWRLMPEIVISKGGYGSLPAVLAAVFYRIPILLHESDSAVGLTNSLVARFSSAIAVSYEVVDPRLASWRYKLFVTGLPIRSEFRLVNHEDARRVFGLTEDIPILLVIGGSQGAQQINEVLLKTLPKLVSDMVVLHVTGPSHYIAVKAVSEELLASSPHKSRYHVFPYLSDTMAAALSVATVVVSRAGATVLAEIAALRKPALLIPLSTSAQDHQRRNAEIFERRGAARVLDSSNLQAALFEHNIRQLISSPELQKTLATGMAQLDYPNAAPDVARLAFKLAVGFRPTKA